MFSSYLSSSVLVLVLRLFFSHSFISEIHAFHAFPAGYPKSTSVFESVSRQVDHAASRASFFPLGSVTPEKQSKTVLNLAKKKSLDTKGNSDVWQEFFNQLLQFNNANGHCDISEDDLYNQDLKTWLIEQRKQYEFLKRGKKSKMTRKRAAALEQIGAVNPM